MNKIERLLDYLTRFHTITSVEAVAKLGDHRLSDTILKLRKRGHRVQCTLFDTVNRHGEKVRPGRYVYLGREAG